MNLLADIPCEYEEKDIQYSKVLGIKNLLINEGNKDFLEKTNLIALYGEWGSGKSSIFKTLKKVMETEQNYVPLIFETWKYEKDDNLAFSLLEFILSNISKITGSKEEIKNILKNKTWNILKNFSKGISIKIPFFNFMDIDFDKMYEENEKSLYTITEEFIKGFQGEIDNIIGKEKNKKILAMIDDLDRCEDENIINLLSALKLMFSVKNIIFICGIDKGAVIQTLLRKYRNKEKSEEYLEKIFPISFNVPKTTELNLFQKDEDENLKRIKQRIIEVTRTTNPRKINKANNKYEFLKEIIPKKNIIEEIKRELIEANENEFHISNFTKTLYDNKEWEKIEKYFDKIINLYLFFNVILFEFYKINDNPIFTKGKNVFNKIEYKISFYDIILINFNLESIENYSEKQKKIINDILNGIDKIKFGKELDEETITIINNLYDFEHLKICLEKEIEKYY
ncbi:KAP family P-loop NTPase fold protein [Fusobacterium polymorphum]|uniref:KAP NTPase domain-containing protein n=1 Tax=Fusobacterium nucleatum subsp. polymorphum TaxID=76857 RepID=A0A2C6B1Z9_FUSNP|nr:P-loop NTPase fold protein [Fusobacterium polymorphum]PHH98576.1 hypothetical protein CA836_01690 [Fusobacterium polymorphum]PIM76609.1 hypothetical protein CTM65_12315 [Fusobacterium polymorphum]